MPVVTDSFPTPLRPGWWAFLRRELAPSPGRAVMTWRLVATTVLVVAISMALQVPEAAISAYMVFFVTKKNRGLTTVVGVLMSVGITAAVAVSLLLYRCTFDEPALRVPLIAAVVFMGMYLARVFVVGPLGFAIGFVVAITQSTAETVPDADSLTRALLWLWVVTVYPIALTVVVNRTVLPAEAGAGEKPALSSSRKPVFVPDALTNPVHPHFALKVTLSAMTCYFLYTGLDWPGIRTAFITCCFIALESTEATLHKAALRLVGCCVGGLLGFLSLVYLIPQMESITSLCLLTAAISALAGWVAAGSERIAYAGLQIALAFYLSVFQGFAPDTDFTKIRDRLVGIVLGIVVTTAVFRFVWPEPAVRTSAPAPTPA